MSSTTVRFATEVNQEQKVQGSQESAIRSSLKCENEMEKRREEETKQALGKMTEDFQIGTVELLLSYSRGQTASELRNFDGKPSISLERYVRRLITYCVVQEADVILALMYICRVRMYTDARIVPTDKNIHRLFLLALTTSIKAHQDNFMSNSYYAQVGGVSLDQFNKMEIAFITFLDWDTDASPTHYADFRKMAHQMGFYSSPTDPLAQGGLAWAAESYNPKTNLTVETECDWMSASSTTVPADLMSATSNISPTNLGSRKGSAKSDPFTAYNAKAKADENASVHDSCAAQWGGESYAETEEAQYSNEQYCSSNGYQGTDYYSYGDYQQGKLQAHNANYSQGYDQAYGGMYTNSYYGY